MKSNLFFDLKTLRIIREVCKEVQNEDQWAVCGAVISGQWLVVGGQ
jgi:hypothetical protein